MGLSLQRRLDGAVEILNRFGILPSEDETSQMAELLDDVVDVEPDKVTAIGRVMQYMGSFNELVRDEIKDVKAAHRYDKITNLFDSIVDDARSMIDQLDDSKLDWKEKASNFWMKLVRGGIPKRFDKIKNIYKDVSRDTRAQLDRDERILDAYTRFRGATKEAEALAYNVKDLQLTHVETAKKTYDAAQNSVVAAEGKDTNQEEMAKLQLARDEAYQGLQLEERRSHLLTDLAEHLKIGYNVSDTVMTKLRQTHDAKNQIYNRSVTFFGTNEHVFTALAATYISQLRLHEATQTLNSMTEGVNQSLETMSELGGKIEQEALEAAHGPTIRAEALQKLVDAVVEYQTTSRQRIRELRDAHSKNVVEIERIVEEGKEKARKVVAQYTIA